MLRICLKLSFLGLILFGIVNIWVDFGIDNFSEKFFLTVVCLLVLTMFIPDKKKPSASSDKIADSSEDKE
jgi:hypothetical protein